MDKDAEPKTSQEVDAYKKLQSKDSAYSTSE